MKSNCRSQFRRGCGGSMSSSGPAGVRLVMLIVGLMLATPGAYAQARKEMTVRPWWVGLELGDGQIKLTSDQFSGTRNPSFELGFAAGHSLGDRRCVPDPKDTPIPPGRSWTSTVSKQPPHRI